MQFTKLFNSILDSTIWQEPVETKVVWITMLAMVDMRGEVQSSIPGLAKRAGVTLEQVEQALECFRSPDKYSRTQEHEGRRIRDISGGWELLNHAKYRALLSAEERREYNRRKQAEYREAAKKEKKPVNDVSMTVNDNVSCAHITEADTDTDTEELTTYPTLPKGRGIYQGVPSEIIELLPNIKGTNATEFHDNAERVFSALWKVTREFPVNDRGDGRVGRVDLVIHHPSGDIGVELDRLSPRKKSVFKLTENFQSWMVILRIDEVPTQKRVLPTGWERWPLRKQKTERVHYNNKLMGRIGRFFNQRETTLWTVADAGMLSKINPEEQDVALMEQYYLAPSIGEHDIRRKDLPTLLNNWNGELNRANVWKCQGHE